MRTRPYEDAALEGVHPRPEPVEGREASGAMSVAANDLMVRERHADAA